MDDTSVALRLSAPVTLPVPTRAILNPSTCALRKNAFQAVLDELSELNKAYRDKNGFVFLVCATGKPADTILALLKARLPNDRETEVSWEPGTGEGWY